MNEEDSIKKHEDAFEMVQAAIASYLKVCLKDYSGDDDISFVNSEAAGWAFELARFVETSLAKDYKTEPQMDWQHVKDNQWKTDIEFNNNKLNVIIDYNKETNLYSGCIKGLMSTMDLGCNPSNNLKVVQNRLENLILTWTNEFIPSLKGVETK